MVRALWCKIRCRENREKINQWQKIAIAACEQCGRNVVPQIRPVMNLANWCAEKDQSVKLNLHPRATYSIRTLPAISSQSVRLLIGPEGDYLHKK